ncbi:MAG: hypothetical protein ACI9J2_000458 [Saprospiraceae bacterium]|jgi:hypothetical protein
MKNEQVEIVQASQADSAIVSQLVYAMMAELDPGEPEYMSLLQMQSIAFDLLSHAKPYTLDYAKPYSVRKKT